MGGVPTSFQQIYILHKHYTTKHMMFNQHPKVKPSTLQDILLFTPQCDELTFPRRIGVAL
jgi:hypothetical protein